MAGAEPVRLVRLASADLDGGLMPDIFVAHFLTHCAVAKCGWPAACSPPHTRRRALRTASGPLKGLESHSSSFQIEVPLSANVAAFPVLPTSRYDLSGCDTLEKPWDMDVSRAVARCGRDQVYVSEAQECLARPRFCNPAQ